MTALLYAPAGQHAVPLLLIDLAIIVVAARGLGAVARRMGQPAVIGEIIAGILLGPSVLGRLAPGLPAQLFPPDVPLKQLAELGLVFFMFLVGLELDPKLIKAEGRRAFAISLAGLVLPFGLGAALGIPLFALNNGGTFLPDVVPGRSQLAFSLFMGAAMCITAFPVLARILVERGLYRARLGTTALCAAAVDDVFAWILLAAVVGITRTGSMGEAGRAFALTAVFIALMLTLGRAALAGLARRYEKAGHLTVDQVAIVVVGVLTAAWTTEWIGIHAIFGAFVFGTIMPRGSRMTHDLTDRIEDFTVVVLLPVFFLVAGLRTNLFAINSGELVMWLAVIISAAILGKLVGCGLAARMNGYSARDSFVLGTLMNTRGLTELVILSIGLSLGVLSDRTFAMMVIMALVTTFMAAPIINRIMPRREMVRVLAGGDPAPVARRVLVALGNPENASALVDAGLHILGAQRPAELVLVRLVPTPRAPEFRTGLRDEESQVDLALADVARLTNRAEAAGATARAVSFISDDVGADLADIAMSQRCNAMLFGWHRASLGRAQLRALYQRVLALAPCDVVVFVDRAGIGLSHDARRPVLVVHDAGQVDAPARAIAERLAATFSSVVRRLEVPSEVATPRESAVRASGLASRLTSRITGGNPEAAPTVDYGNVFDGVVRETSGAAALVIATSGTIPENADFDYPAEVLAAVAECPVIVVRPAARS